MKINSDAYPSQGMSTDYRCTSDTLLKLYESSESTLVFGQSMDQSNVAAFLNSDCRLSGLTHFELTDTTAMIVGDHIPGAANLRWGWIDNADSYGQINNGYNCISNAANTDFIDPDYGNYDALNHGTRWAPFTKLDYRFFAAQCEYIVLDIPGTGSPILRTYAEDDLESNLLEDGYAQSSYGISQLLCGVYIKFYGTQYASSNADAFLSTRLPIMPMLEHYTPDGIYFGTPFFYSSIDRINVLADHYLWEDGDISKSHYPWYNEGYCTFGATNGTRYQTTQKLRSQGWFNSAFENNWSIGYAPSGTWTYTQVQNVPPRGSINDEGSPVFGFYKGMGSELAVNYIRITNKTECYNMVASLGCLFTFSKTIPWLYISPNMITDRNVPAYYLSYMYLGKLYDDGHTDGSYLHADEIYVARQMSTHSDVFDIDFVPIDPSKPYDPPIDADEITTATHNTETSLPALDGIRTVSGDAFSTFYNLSIYHVRELGNRLAQMPQSFWDALGTATDSKQSNLLDYIISLKWYPVSIMHDADDTAVTSLQFGFNANAAVTLTSAGTSYKVSNINRIFNMGTVSIGYRSQQRGFLDFEPYTSVSLYLPYIGTTPLQCNDVLGHTVSCTYVIDFSTGMCTALVANDLDTLYIGTGKIGVDISVTGNDILTQSEQIVSAYGNATLRSFDAALSLGGSIASDNITGTVSSIVAGVSNIANSALSIANSKRGVPATVGVASGFGGSYTHQFPYITVRRPAVSIPGAYGHDIGYVCNRTYTISSLTGFTVCQNPDLTGIPATATEIDMLRSILCTGFYA